MADYYIERTINRQPRFPKPSNAVCKYCDEKIQWLNRKNKWVPLDNDGGIHLCNLGNEFDDN